MPRPNLRRGVTTDIVLRALLDGWTLTNRAWHLLDADVLLTRKKGEFKRVNPRTFWSLLDKQWIVRAPCRDDYRLTDAGREAARKLK